MQTQTQTAHDLIRTLLILWLAVIVIVIANAAEAQDDDDCCRPCRDRQGLVLGLNVGFGGAALNWESGNTSTHEDPAMGAIGGCRIGYAFSDHFALTLDAFGFGTGGREGEEWGMGAAFLTATWYPDGSGFFLRLGAGGGGGEYLAEGADEPTRFGDKGAGLVALGYEWQVSQNFALGLSCNAFGFDLEGLSGHDNDSLGVGGMTLQMNWYL